MIPKILTGKTSSTGLIRYLFGPGRANEHTDPHLVASWNGFAPDPGLNAQHTTTQLARQLDQPVKVLGDRAPADKVWHCPVRADAGDRYLTDAEWAEVARRIVHATGIAPAGDPEACRWVAVRHADDHIHIAATLVRQDGKRPTRDFDRKKAQAEARRIEIDYGLRRLNPGDGSAAKRPTSKEHFKARRIGQAHTSRELLRTRVRQAAAAARSETEFFAALEGMGIEAQIRYAPSGDALGYKVALPGDTNKTGEPVFFSGSTLAADLSLPRIRERQTATDTTAVQGHARRTDPWHQATASIDRIPATLASDEAPAAQAHLAALGETLDLLPAITNRGTLRSELQQAAHGFERATRSRIRADHQRARALRNAAKELLHTPSGDASGLAMLLNATVLALIAASRWHAAHRHTQQEAAARQTLQHVQAAYQQAAAHPLAELRRRTPPQDTARRYAHHIRQTTPDHAEHVLTDPAWNALTAVLADAEQAGHNPAELLQHAARQRTLDDAHSPAEVLTWRLQRLSQRPAPSPRAQAARVRSTRATTAAPQPVRPTAAPQHPVPTVTHRRRR
ncbi:relaxase/mobilization nuclease domain-containing protein [Streptomyces oceani]|uniref:Mobilization protein n=1 Tax=Streptomyces oceani TaxID=1075402 RepID=A0A1E7JX90_9ACTN|nr:mobilization protein [Streptomyces oceani]OEU96266.1 mobilization protein [Streptomyces oceani]